MSGVEADPTFAYKRHIGYNWHIGKSKEAQYAKERWLVKS